MLKIAVTDLEYNKAADIFKSFKVFECICAPSEENELAEFIIRNNISHVIVGVNKYQGALYNALPRGGVIARFGVGCDGINKVLVKKKELYCTNTPGALDNSVAECAVGLMLAVARHLPDCAADNKKQVWKNRIGIEISGKTLAVIGCGNIGGKVARIAKSGYEMKVVGFDIVEPQNNHYFDEFTKDFSAAVKNADFVSLHIPDTTATKDFINSRRLAMMKSTAILINTARGAILDEDALYDAIQSGTISGAALDVFKSEPYIPQSRDKDLRSCKNIIMTPHLGSSTIEACERMAEIALNNIRLCIEGKIEEMNITYKILIDEFIK